MIAITQHSEAGGTIRHDSHTAALRASKKRQRARANPDPHALAWTIPDAQAMGAPGKTSIYALAKAGKLRLARIGGRTMVDAASLRALLGVDAA